MKTRSLYKTLIALAAPFLVAACSSDSDDIPAPPVEDNFEGIIINVPTRATAAANLTALEGDEGTIQNLTVLAYEQTPDNNGNLPVVEVKPITEIDKLTADYQSVRMRLKKGSYHIYVVANVTPDDWEHAPTNVSEWEDLSEEQLQKLQIKTEPNYNDENLPMSCNYLAIRKTKTVINGDNVNWGTPFTDGLVTLDDDNPRVAVYADLTFAVAKLRYTIVNGKAKYLKMGSTADSRVQILNYAGHASLMTHAEDIDDDHLIESANVGGSGAYYEWPDDEAHEYDDSEGPVDGIAFSPDKKIETAESSDEFPALWCYRGTVYVPERLFKSMEEGNADLHQDNPTEIKFNFSIDHYSDKAHRKFGGKVTIPSSQTGTEDHIHYGIIRGVVYEVKAFTTRKDITLQVRVRPWAYQKYTWIM